MGPRSMSSSVALFRFLSGDVSLRRFICVTQKRDEEICLAYKLKALEGDADANYGVKLIPLKDLEITLTEEDCLVVVAEDDR